MKNLLLTTLFLFVSLPLIQAQGYIRGGAGVGIGTTKDAYGLPAVTKDSSNVIISQRTIFGSFGQGARFSLAGGYMITPYFGVELEFYYFQGFKQEYGSTSGPVGDQYARTGYSYQMRATPSFVVQAPEGKFQPFARFGVLIPFWGKTVLEDNIYNSTAQVETYKKTNIDGKFSVGFESSIGCQYNINENLGVYIQATYTGLRIRSDKGTVIEWHDTDNSGNVTDKVEGADKVTVAIEFQDELTAESNTHPLLKPFVPGYPQDIYVPIQGTLDFSKPLNLPTQSSNFNALTFSLGIKYSFNSGE